MNASLFYISQLLGYRIFRWLFNFTFSWLFNFTKFWWYKVTYYTGFNPRPHAGDDRIRITRLRMRFNPRRHAGATTTPLNVFSPQLSFNPHPTREATGLAHTSGCSLVVSIHAPTRGATRAGTLTLVCYNVSIHAPTRGATGTSWLGAGVMDSFNPRPARGATSWCSSSLR